MSEKGAGWGIARQKCSTMSCVKKLHQIQNTSSGEWFPELILIPLLLLDFGVLNSSCP